MTTDASNERVAVITQESNMSPDGSHINNSMVTEFMSLLHSEYDDETTSSQTTPREISEPVDVQDDYDGDIDDDNVTKDHLKR